ncbi:uncharacterized protein HMPREF1541_11033 [Cyphellophora europaea CBS 101466]|uniref:SnoaL-like domain-containing protein n=1 Tax=Cyphellophora europaea (strain CBS 101466) TaxID=1220924 RepID=W2S5F9_CYPE1|nr:uncharacterized protein HMPREF1541_11033 [Cyphellophora europaea CBS 101466]ETN43902.1 hypothetical protein HMPREF1541_11033 [Cyphellophora europaea CBS 101466]
MTPYNPTHYLLDRAQIHDTITKLYTLLDQHLWSRLASSEVFAPTFTVDYSSMFGGQPRETTPGQIVEQWRGMLEKWTGAVHALSGVLIEGLPLPSPLPLGALQGAARAGMGDEVAGGDVEETVTQEEDVTHAKVSSYVTVHIVKKGAEGGEQTSNGGMGAFEVVKLGVDECRGLYGEGWDGNRWRIKSMKPRVVWYEGNAEGILGVKGV